MDQRLNVPSGKRVGIIGPTGSGKSEGMLFLLAHDRQPQIILDTKIEPAFERLENIIVHDGLANFDPAKEFKKFRERQEHAGHAGYLHTAPQPRFLVRPLEDENNPEDLDDFIYSLYQGCRNVSIAIDEMLSLMIGGSAGAGVIALMTRGRSRGLTTYYGSQRPSWISLFCLSEADYFMLFRLNLQEDRDRMRKVIGDDHEEMESKLARHHFYWYNVSENALTSFTPVPPVRPSVKSLPQAAAGGPRFRPV